MSDETRKTEQHHDNEPQVFAVSKNLGGKWKFNRRDFVKAAGTTAAITVAAGQLGRQVSHEARAEPNRQDVLDARAHYSDIFDLAFSPDGTRLVTGGEDMMIKLWSMPEGALLRTFEGHADMVWKVAFSPDGTLIASGDRASTIRIWRLFDGELITTIRAYDRGNVHDLMFNEDGTLLFSTGGYTDFISQWSVPDGQLHGTLDLEGSSQRLQASPDRSRWVSSFHTAEGDGIDIWSMPENQRINTFYPGTVFGRIALSPSGTLLAIGTQNIELKNVTLWSIPEGQLLATFGDYEDTVDEMAISPDGQLLAAADSYGIKIWSLPDAELHLTIKDNWVAAMSFSPDGSQLVCGNTFGHLKVIAVPSGELVKEIYDIAACTDKFEAIQYSPGNAGESVVTLPSNSELPEGAVCICNTVRGASCACVAASNSGPSNHYWHPN